MDSPASAEVVSHDMFGGSRMISDLGDSKYIPYQNFRLDVSISLAFWYLSMKLVIRAQNSCFLMRYDNQSFQSFHASDWMNQTEPFHVSRKPFCVWMGRLPRKC